MISNNFIIRIFVVAKQTLHLKMKPKLIFKRENKNVKKPLKLKNGVFLIYALNKAIVGPMKFTENDSNIVVTLSKEQKGYFTSILKQDEIERLTGNPQRIWMGVLNRHLFRSIVIQKHRPVGFFAIKPNNNIDIEHETTMSAKNKAKKLEKNDGNAELNQAVF